MVRDHKCSIVKLLSIWANNKVVTKGDCNPWPPWTGIIRLLMITLDNMLLYHQDFSFAFAWRGQHSSSLSSPSITPPPVVNKFSICPNIQWTLKYEQQLFSQTNLGNDGFSPFSQGGSILGQAMIQLQWTCLNKNDSEMKMNCEWDWDMTTIALLIFCYLWKWQMSGHESVSESM